MSSNVESRYYYSSTDGAASPENYGYPFALEY
jgi:hypothetical protein